MFSTQIICTDERVVLLACTAPHLTADDLLQDEGRQVTVASLMPMNVINLARTQTAGFLEFREASDKPYSRDTTVRIE